MKEKNGMSSTVILENIQRLCKENNTTIWALERATQIGNGVIGRWSASFPRVDSLAKVAEYFGVTLDDLLKEE